MHYFRTVFMEEAEMFLSTLESKAVKKVLYNIELAEQTLDPRLLKKLKSDIWEFRTKYAGQQIRVLAFWDKRNSKNTLVVATHGFIKKSSKTPEKALQRAIRLKERYFTN